jgi:hypothetical protein
MRQLLLLLLAVLAAPVAADDLRMNHTQTMASHNSYKQAIDPALLQLMLAADSSSAALDYAHLPLAAQLDLGLRKLELDVFHDPEGDRFSRPWGVAELRRRGLPAAPHDPEGRMAEPGFKVLHIQDLDFRTHCYTLRDCLTEVRDWSDAHPDHLPLAISFNAKTGKPNVDGAIEALPFTPQVFDALDEEILAVLPRERLIVPDDVRGEAETLEAAVLSRGWPHLDEARGRVLFVLDQTGEKQRAYVQGHPSLRGRVMFVNAEPGRPEAAFLILNDPLGGQAEIQQRVRQGYLVRTRADAGTWEARRGDSARLRAALSSGAHFISTDYYVPDERFGTGYVARLPGEVAARCNPVTAPAGCGPGDLAERE